MRLFILAATVLAISFPALAYHSGHDDSPPEIRAWFERQKQPDNPPVSCCGDYDAYRADGFVQEGGEFYAIITEAKNGIEYGTKVRIPPSKMPRDNADPNPTGHGIVFMSISWNDGKASPGFVYCFFPPLMG